MREHRRFDKSLDELSQGIQQYDKVQDGLLKDLSALKKAMEESNQKVIAARKEYKKLNDEPARGPWTRPSTSRSG